MNNHHSTPVPENTVPAGKVPENNADRTTPEGRPAPSASPVSSPVGNPFKGGQAYGWGAPPSSVESQSRPLAGWGGSGPDGRSKPWTVKRGVVAAGAAVVLVGGAGAGMYALASSAAAAGSADANAGSNTDGGALQETLPGARGGGAQGGFADGGMPQGGPGNFAPEGLGGMGSGVSAAVHAEYVTLQDGAYVTKVEQQGTVTEVSSDSVTVESTEGFSRTYSLDSDVAVSNQQQRRQQAGGVSSGTLTVADIVSGAVVRIVAAKATASRQSPFSWWRRRWQVSPTELSGPPG